MSRALVILKSKDDRERAARWAMQMPWGTRIEFRLTKRTLPQNALMWACLTEVSRQVVWYGQKLSTEDWKNIFTASLNRMRVVPGIDGGSFVPLGIHTSIMTKDELSQMIELIKAFGAEHNVRFHDQEQTPNEAA